MLVNLNDVLKQAQKEIYLQKQIKNKKLFEKLQKRLQQLMEIDSNKYFLSLTLQQNENIKMIVNGITNDEMQKEFLLDNYEKALKQVIKLYHGDIVKNKMDLKAQKEQAKNENKKKIARWLLFNYIMTDILKALPKPFNKKRKYWNLLFFVVLFLFCGALKSILTAFNIIDI